MMLHTYFGLSIRIDLRMVLVPIHHHLLPLLDNGRRELQAVPVEISLMFRPHFDSFLEQ